ncbi:hypothetical protein GWI33_012587 [Rhynchophorus ferrugineus]|uniref:Probable RNA-binding protein EIF1AD n=1 Tax=Rhynchophorus ferrugineus TaxID=354439 RepID=A0A834MAR9_RHYFE|nr:hypothetical protein GWI33_012587 [Rhynchophorus ferrugineus]
MSRAVRYKHVLREILRSGFDLPTEEQQIVRLVSTGANNLHKVADSKGATFLVSMPNKLRKNMWLQRRDYLLIEPIMEGNKVKGEIVKILGPDDIKYFKKENVWPAIFSSDGKARPEGIASSSVNRNEDRTIECSSENSDDEEENDY